MIRMMAAAIVIVVAALAVPQINGANSALAIVLAAPFAVVWLLWPRRPKTSPLGTVHFAPQRRSPAGNTNHEDT